LRRVRRARAAQGECVTRPLTAGSIAAASLGATTPTSSRHRPIIGRLHCSVGAMSQPMPRSSGHPTVHRPAPLQRRRAVDPGVWLARLSGRSPAGLIAATGGSPRRPCSARPPASIGRLHCGQSANRGKMCC